MIGPEETSIGLATINGMIHETTGVQMIWYEITSYLGILSILVGLCFACIGFVQLIRRRSLLKVDAEILSLCCLYVILAVLYILFELVVINERPIIMPGDEHVEASFPSSHTLLSFAIFGSAMIVIGKYVRNRRLCNLIQFLFGILILIAVFGRLLSGVHWFTDILGSLFLSAALLLLFTGLLDLAEKRTKE
jgi:PAP2 superfamily.